jgi:Ni/Fe-hydrogenase subunit HybB-like protein
LSVSDETLDAPEVQIGFPRRERAAIHRIVALLSVQLGIVAVVVVVLASLEPLTGRPSPFAANPFGWGGFAMGWAFALGILAAGALIARQLMRAARRVERPPP